MVCGTAICSQPEMYEKRSVVAGSHLSCETVKIQLLMLLSFHSMHFSSFLSVENQTFLASLTLALLP